MTNKHIIAGWVEEGFSPEEAQEMLCCPNGEHHNMVFVSFEGCIDCTLVEKCSKCGYTQEIES